MAETIEERLAERGIVLLPAPAPAANYAPFVVSGNHVYVSGQLPMIEGNVKYVGCVGRSLTIELGQTAARLCALNVVAQVKAACGDDLERVVRCLRIGGFVNATREFMAHPAVINGASDLIVEVFGDKGLHSRVAIGVSSLPFNSAVEIDAAFEIIPPAG